MKSNDPIDTSSQIQAAASKRKLRIAILGLFGISVIASGLWRFFSAEGGHAGLWFGLAMGGLALVSATFFLNQQVKPAMICGWLSLLLVGGWFCYESFVKKGIDNAEPRQLIIIGITFSAAGWLFWTILNNDRSSRSVDRIEN